MNDFHDMDEVDRRIADALRAAAGQVDEHSLRPALSPRSTSLLSRRHIRWTAPVLAAAAVVAIVAGTVAVTSSTSSSSPRRIQPGSGLPDSSLPVSTTTSSPSVGVITSSPSVLSAPPTATTLPTATELPSAACPFADVPCKTTMDSYYVPIWPFTSYTEADTWLAKSGATGSSPWHEDAVATAENYVQNVLGFSDLTVFSQVAPSKSTREAYVTAGYVMPNNDVSVAATLHLVRYGNEADAGWEVVGTEDDPQYLTIDRPSYGTNQPSPAAVSGTFTGVDGNLVVTVRDRSGTVVATSGSIASGGVDVPWRVSLDYRHTFPGVHVAVVFAGGSLVQHAHFAIQGFYD